MPGDDAFYFDERLKRWVSPFVMAAINTRVVRRTHALSNIPTETNSDIKRALIADQALKAMPRGCPLLC